jgi:hypothetical protein
VLQTILDEIPSHQKAHQATALTNQSCDFHHNVPSAIQPIPLSYHVYNGM